MVRRILETTRRCYICDREANTSLYKVYLCDDCIRIWNLTPKCEVPDVPVKDPDPTPPTPCFHWTSKPT